jgi:hypothetical protein
MNAVDRSHGIVNFWLIESHVIWEDRLVTLTSEEFSFDEFNMGGGGAWEARSSNLEPGNYLSICLKTEENQAHLCRDGR